MSIHNPDDIKIRKLSDRATLELKRYNRSGYILFHIEFHGITDLKKPFEKRNVFFALGPEEARRLVNTATIQIAELEEYERTK